MIAVMNACLGRCPLTPDSGANADRFQVPREKHRDVVNK